jgi:hypothetical protein
LQILEESWLTCELSSALAGGIRYCILMQDASKPREPMKTRTIEVPEDLYAQLEQRAHAAAQSMDAVVIRTLASSLSPAPEPDPPQAVQDELAVMEHLSDEALWAIARSTMNSDALALYDLLRDRKEEGSLTPEGQQRLARLTLDADALALRKAHA